MSRPECSLEYWNRILEQDPRNKVILTRAGDAYRTLNNLDKAQEYYERALNIEFDVYAVLGLALTAKAREKYDEAVASLKHLIQQDNRNYRLYIELSDCYIKKGERLHAVETLEEFKKFGIRNTYITETLERI
jgi:tetratricopeptide (TPR) repeat protein